MIRNLVYHCYPLASNDGWRWNLDQLRQRLSLFNGKRVIAVATDSSTESLRTVKNYLASKDIRWIEVANDPRLGEVVSWVPLWESVKSQPADSVTFRAHAKGVTECDKQQTIKLTGYSSNIHGCVTSRTEMAMSWNPIKTSAERSQTMRLWTKILYEANLDYWKLVKAAFARGRSMVGVLKQTCKGPDWYPIGLTSPWQYLGTFYWVRNGEFFDKDWQTVTQSFYGTEMWPGLNFPNKSAASLFYHTSLGRVPMNEYPFVKKIAEKFEQWKSRHEVSHEAFLVSQ